jgi:hypothetical protein
MSEKVCSFYYHFWLVDKEATSSECKIAKLAIQKRCVNFGKKI